MTTNTSFTCRSCGTGITFNDDKATWDDFTGDTRCGNPRGVHTPGTNFVVAVEVSIDLDDGEKPTPALIAKLGWESIAGLEAPMVEIRQSVNRQAPIVEFDMEDLVNTTD